VAVRMAKEVRVNGVLVPEPWRGVVVGADAQAVFRYDLPPGYYRVRLLPKWPSGPAIVEAFALATGPPPESPAEAGPASPGDALPAAGAPAAAPEVPRGDKASQLTTVELRGLATAEGREPRFAVLLTLPDGAATQRDLTLDDVLYDTWKVAEYNRENQTVALARGNRFLILHRGVPATLPDPEEDAGPEGEPVE